ncbi:MAG: 2,3-bisphosphoglycerate-independent phosphoglycerate mutase [Ignavibacteria bacterium]|nr:2,3-bisphosphoglycerate-independent phosphoglycerate mutase [Ignavibacteria bacterium]
MDPSTKVVLIILDGFGLGKNPKIDAIAQAKKPFIDHLFATYPWTAINASSEDVGLPTGQMGNSEVGHMNIGAGRVVYQEITRINRSIRMGDFFQKDAFVGAINNVKHHHSSLHYIGLLSEGGVHSLNTHLYALLELAKRHQLERVYVHALLDGRDTPPENGVKYIADLLDKMRELGVGAVATITGRYYGMDRDNRWDRTEKAYRAMTEGIGLQTTDPLEAVRQSYARGITDEFILPIVVGYNGKQVSSVQDHDSIIFFNFRTDRPRQMTRAFIEEEFDKFPRRKLDLYYATMTQYHEDFHCPVAFPPTFLTKTLGEIISTMGLMQLHLAETEKYAHVTFFFNGGREDPFPGEDRVLIPSPRGVPTYDRKPEMSAYGITDKAIEALASSRYAFIVMNYANADMVGHSGKIEATIRAVEVIDDCLNKVVPTALAKGYTVLITADHGNADKMVDDDGGPHTAHTTNWVPFIVARDGLRVTLRREGKLADIAPTILQLMGIPAPEEMDGVSMIEDI